MFEYKLNLFRNNYWWLLLCNQKIKSDYPEKSWPNWIFLKLEDSPRFMQNRAKITNHSHSFASPRNLNPKCQPVWETGHRYFRSLLMFVLLRSNLGSKFHIWNSKKLKIIRNLHFSSKQISSHTLFHWTFLNLDLKI